MTIIHSGDFFFLKFFFFINSFINSYLKGGSKKIKSILSLNNFIKLIFSISLLIISHLCKELIDSIFFFRILKVFIFFSIKNTLAHPLDKNSIPKDPLPEKISKILLL